MPRKLKEYDPVKAGAEIIECFDITGKIAFPVENYLFAYDGKMITSNYDLVMYGDSFYIRTENKIYVFNKNTFAKEKEITIRFPNGYRHYPEPYQIYRYHGLVIIGDYAIFMCSNEGNRQFENYLLLIDLLSGNTTIFNDEAYLGKNIYNGYSAIIGYDRIHNIFWLIKRCENWNTNLYLYNYDKATNGIIPYKSVKGCKAGRENYDYPNGLDISGDEIWYVYNSIPAPNGYIRYVEMEKRNINNMDTGLAYINVEYLGTLSMPQSIVYDKPYIWIMVERDDQIQMLKLLPNE